MITANFVTLTRLILSLASFACLIRKGPVCLVAALFLYLIAALMDILDGYLARKLKGETSFGKLIDPIADKIQTLPPFIFFAWSGLYSIGWVAPIVVREVAVTFWRARLATQGKIVVAERLGKIKTLFQHVTIVASIYFYFSTDPFFKVDVKSSFWQYLNTWTHFYLILAVILTVWSGIQFFIKNKA